MRFIKNWLLLLGLSLAAVNVNPVIPGFSESVEQEIVSYEQTISTRKATSSIRLKKVLFFTPTQYDSQHTGNSFHVAVLSSDPSLSRTILYRNFRI